jgi:cytochrome oxidase assembly protein ShyY1
VRSFRFLLSRRWTLFTVAVAVLVWGTWWLGNWQYGRLQNTRHMNAVVATNLARAPQPVGQVMSTTAQVGTDVQWTRVKATGTYDSADTLVWRYLTDDHSDPGVDQVVPFTTTSGMTLLVDRGWVSSSQPDTMPADAPQPPTGTVTVVGWVQQNGTGESTDVAAGGFRALNSTAVAAALGRPTSAVYDGFVNLSTENGHAPAGMGQVDMPDPSQTWVHFFYWLQWWFFGLVAIFGYFYLMREDWLAAGAGVRRTERDTPRRARQVARTEQKQRVRAAYQAAYAAERQAKRTGPSTPSAASAPALPESDKAPADTLH